MLSRLIWVGGTNDLASMNLIFPFSHYGEVRFCTATQIISFLCVIPHGLVQRAVLKIDHTEFHLKEQLQLHLYYG